MKKPLVYIVIVNYNGQKYLKNCLNSIKKLNLKYANLEVIVVDNNSDDNSIVNAQSLYPEYKYIKNNTNLGFSGANNIGIAKALANKADYIWLINNDTILDKDALVLVESFEKNDIGIAGSKILFAPGYEYHKHRYKESQLGHVIWYAGGIINWDNMYAFHRGVDEVDIGQFDNLQETEFVSGCSMMVRSGVFEKTGILNNKLFLYLEDLEYCLRAKSYGWKLIYNPKSIIWHINAGTSGGSGSQIQQYYMTRNRLWLGFKYASIRTKLALFRESIKFVLKGNNIRRQAVFDAMLGHYGKQK